MRYGNIFTVTAFKRKDSIRFNICDLKSNFRVSTTFYTIGLWRHRIRMWIKGTNKCGHLHKCQSFVSLKNRAANEIRIEFYKAMLWTLRRKGSVGHCWRTQVGPWNQISASDVWCTREDRSDFKNIYVQTKLEIFSINEINGYPT